MGRPNNIGCFDSDGAIMDGRVEFRDGKGIGIGSNIFWNLDTIFGSKLLAITNPVKGWLGICLDNYFDRNGFIFL